MIYEMRNNLRALGVPIHGPSVLLGDNQSVVTNTTLPSSTLKKKHNSIAYHKVREGIAAGIFGFAHISGKINAADILTKPVDTVTHRTLTQPLLFRKPQPSNQGEYQNGMLRHHIEVDRMKGSHQIQTLEGAKASIDKIKSSNQNGS